jgi:hypothetical protein
MDELNDGLQQPQDEMVLESQGQGEIMQESNELRSHVEGREITGRQPYGSLANAQQAYDERNVDIADERVAVEESVSNTRQVKIERLSSGFLVTVGCQRVAVESTKKLTTMLAKYYENPRDFEKKWYSNDVVNRLDNIN